MAVRIGSNISSIQAQRRLLESSAALSNAYERLSSGQRINKASDDAAGLAISEQLKANVRVFNQGVRNVNDALSMTAIVEQALIELKNITSRQQELAQQAANGVYSGSQREALDKEAQQLTNEYNRITLTTEFNGRSLFASTWDAVSVQAGYGAEGALGFKIGDELAAKITAGSYFIIHSPYGTKAYYFRIDGQGTAPSVPGAANVAIDLYSQTTAERTQVAFFAAPAGGEYLTLNSPQRSYYVWFDSGGSTDPALTGTGIRIATNGLDRLGVAAAVASALADTGEFTTTDLGGGGVSITNVEGGYVRDATDNSGSIMTFGIQQGQGGLSGRTIAQQVADSLPSTQFTVNLAAEDSMLTVTIAATGNYRDSQDINSNVWISTLQQGSGMINSWTGCGDVDIAFADFNNDGNMDIVGAAYSENKVTVRLGYGDGTYATTVSYSVGANPHRVTTADLNGDGYADILCADWSANGLSVLLNNGDGTFAPRVGYDMGSTADVTAADFDGDGYLDVASTDGAGVRVRLNNGDGTFGAANVYAGGATKRLAAADLNGDGKADLVTVEGASNTMSVWINNGNGTFGAPAVYSTGANATAVALADFNGDGKLDIADIDASDSRVSVWMNNGNGTFGARASYSTGGSDLVAADFNGDGKTDIATTGHSLNRIDVLLNSGGSFSAAVSYTAYSGQGLDAADLNNDGKIDIGTADGHAIRLNNGDGTFYDALGDRNEILELSFGDARGRVQVNQLDLTTGSGARAALTALSARLSRISNELGAVGANKSRLESGMNVMAAAAENFSIAESRIRDVDIAEETANLLKTRILQEVASSVLSHANQVPALAVQLLRDA